MTWARFVASGAEQKLGGKAEAMPHNSRFPNLSGIGHSCGAEGNKIVSRCRTARPPEDGRNAIAAFPSSGAVPASVPARGVMKKLPASAMFTVFLGLGIAAFAQNPNQRTPPSQQPDQNEQNEQADGKSMTLTGCLMKGEKPDEYAITDNKSGEKISFAAPDQLQRYINQTVQIAGTIVTRGGAKEFRPQSVKAISPSCERSQ